MSLEQSNAPDFTLESTAGDDVTLSETLEEGPTVVLINRGHWCSFCAEQLQTFSEVAYDLWFNDDVDILPVVTDPIGKVTEMRDRYDLGIQLLADPDGEAAEQYSGTEPHVVRRSLFPSHPPTIERRLLMSVDLDG